MNKYQITVTPSITREVQADGWTVDKDGLLSLITSDGVLSVYRQWISITKV